MNVDYGDPLSRIEQHEDSGTTLIKAAFPGHQEFFVTASRADGEPIEAVFKRAADAAASEGAAAVAIDVFGASPEHEAAIEAAFGEAATCAMVLCAQEDTPPGAGGVQVWAVAGVPVRNVESAGRILGHSFEDGEGTWVRLGGLTAAGSDLNDRAQAEAIFEVMRTTLDREGMDFSHVVRTWFYNRDILAWYDTFNEVRTAFFEKHGVFDGLVPASTGIGGGNPAGSALVAGLLAMKAKQGRGTAAAVPSPLQCPALEYGSSFSRAVEVSSAGARRLLVSGTASIAPEGATVHIENTSAQIALTMGVAKSILKSRGMAWKDVTRAVAYVRRPEDLPRFAAYAKRVGLPPMPVLVTHNVVCRDDLLFEVELDAVLAT